MKPPELDPVDTYLKSASEIWLFHACLLCVSLNGVNHKNCAVYLVAVYLNTRNCICCSFVQDDHAFM